MGKKLLALRPLVALKPGRAAMRRPAHARRMRVCRRSPARSSAQALRRLSRQHRSCSARSGLAYPALTALFATYNACQRRHTTMSARSISIVDQRPDGGAVRCFGDASADTGPNARTVPRAAQFQPSIPSASCSSASEFSGIPRRTPSTATGHGEHGWTLSFCWPIRRGSKRSKSSGRVARRQGSHA